MTEFEAAMKWLEGMAPQGIIAALVIRKELEALRGAALSKTDSGRDFMTDYTAIRETLENVEAYFDSRAEAEYFPDRASPIGSEEMHLLVDCRAALESLAALSAELAAGRAAALAYNSALRSAHAIAEREGRETNWPPYLKSLKAVLDAHHETFVRALKAQPMPEAGPGETGGAVVL